MFYADRFCDYTEDATHYIFKGKCIKTGKEYCVRVPKEELYAYNSTNKSIQEAMPSVSSEDREFLMSGLSPEGWKMVLPENDNEDS